MAQQHPLVSKIFTIISKPNQITFKIHMNKKMHLIVKGLKQQKLIWKQINNQINWQQTLEIDHNLILNNFLQLKINRITTILVYLI